MNECLNNYDEENCPEVVCSAGFFKCNLDNVCINATKRCDGNIFFPNHKKRQI